MVALGFAILGAAGAQAYLLPDAPAPDKTAQTTIVSSPTSHGDSATKAHPYTTRSDSRGSAAEPAFPADGAHRFLTYDAATRSYGYADESGTVVIEARFQRAGQFVEGLAPVQLQSDSGGAEYGFIDTEGAVVIRPRFRSAFAFSEGLARVEVKVDGFYRYGFIDRSGTMLIEPRHEAAWDFSQGLARVGSSDASGPARYGFIDRTGTLVVSLRFESARDFSEGLAAVAIDGEWGYIDRAGDWVIEPRFPQAQSFLASGWAAVDLEEPGAVVGEKVPTNDDFGPHQALIDKTGRVVWERQNDQG